MKNLLKLSFLLIPVLLVTSSCLKNNNDNVTPVNIFIGKYSGKFSVLKIRSLNPKRVDTVKTESIDLQLTDQGYTVTPGVTAFHSASNGAYLIYNGGSIEFADKNVTDTTGKVRLNGIYGYSASALSGNQNVVDSLIMGTPLQYIGRDSIQYFYQLKKAN